MLAREQLVHFTVLGIRFWDQTRDLPVSDTLEVTARREGSPHHAVRAVPSASGIYVFHRLPGLREWEIRGDDQVGFEEPLNTESAVRQPFIVDVKDRKKRFLPVARRVELPLPQRGLLLSSPLQSHPSGTPPGFYLFSSPSRPTPAGMAAIRAQLKNVHTEQPAAHAVLTADVDGETRYGIADDEGRVTLLFPYPQLETQLTGSIPAGRTPFSEQQWKISISVNSGPAALEPLEGVLLPDLRDILHQEQGQILPSISETSIPEAPQDTLEVTVHYGRETIVRTEGSSFLWIRPADSSFP